MSPRELRPRRPRRPRGAAESLGAIVLGFESIIVFLAGLVVYGLKALPAGVADGWGVAGGAVLAVIMILTTRFTGTRAGIVVGWVLQALVLAAGLLVPAVAVVGLIFGGMWAYATIKGGSLDRRSAARGDAPPAPPAPPRDPSEEETT